MAEEIGGSWSARVVVPFELTEAFEQVFTGLAGVVSLYEFSPDGKLWAVEGQFAEVPPKAELAERLALAAVAVGISEPDLTLTAVRATDWLTANIASFPPLTAGRFYIHGDHIKGPFPAGMLRMEVNAATAFGSGEHSSTRGCLLALDALRKRAQRCRRALDMGCGTGILAMAIAKAWAKPVLAADIDPEAVRVTRRNIRRNGVASRVTAVLSEGCGQREITRRTYDIVTANILARPLVHMSRDLTRRLAPGGRLILAGLLTRHESMVQAAYRAQRLRLVGRIRLKDWSTLVFAKSGLFAQNRGFAPD